jgi:uncharacterized protein (TIGR00730 family)
MELCVFGAASDNVPEVYIKQTETLGERMAARGHGLVFGGGSTGMMGAAARGVRKGGGRIIGVAPRFFDVPGVLTELCDELILTDTMAERKIIMEDRADGFIIAPGGIGTMDEFFQVLTLRSLQQHQKPVALLNTAGFYDELLAFLRTMEAQTFISPALWDCLGVFADPDDLLDYMEQ